MIHTCPKCGGKMEAGVATAAGLLFGAVTPKSEPRLQFVVPGTQTSMNPITAVRQGLTDEPSDRVFWIKGNRCSECGFLELYANESAPG